jgi:long-chain fatty acid transport protein
VDPAPFAVPNSNNTYPSADHADEAWGFGAQMGVLYQGANGWSFGASYKTTQFFEDFEWNSADQNGLPRKLKFSLDFPSIASLGAAYTGLDKWTFAADVRYIDYENTDGFDKGGFASTGAVSGFGWDSIFVVALGTQYQVSDRFLVRAGYSYNSNPIDDSDTFFNVAAPAIIQHHIAGGFTYKVRDNFMLDASFTYGFENSISGPLVNPSIGNVPGSSVESEMSTWSIVFGLRINF